MFHTCSIMQITLKNCQLKKGGKGKKILKCLALKFAYAFVKRKKRKQVADGNRYLYKSTCCLMHGYTGHCPRASKFSTLQSLKLK